MGILANAMKKNAVVLQKPSGTVAIRVDLDAIQRKFYDALLYVAKETLKKDMNKESFTVSLSDLKLLLDKTSKEKMDKNNRYYVEKLKELKEKNAEYNILDKDTGWDIEGWVSLMSELQVKRNIKTEQIEIVFDLPKRIRKALIDPKGIYANLNLVIIRGLKSKYAIILYELVKDYEKVEIPEMTIDDFRKLFNIENKYKGRMDHLKSKVLEPAVNELNNNENVDFLVSYELKKTGKVYTHIKFHVKPKPTKVKLEQQAKKVLEAEVKENDEAKELLALIPPEYRRRNRVVSLVLGSLKENGKEYTKAQIEYAVNKLKSGKIKSFSAYLKNAIEKDYAGFEEVDIDFVTPEDAVGYRGDIKWRGEKRYVEIAHIEIKEPEEQGVGYDKERRYLIRLDDAETGELVTWWEVSEKKLLEYARRNVEKRKARKEM